MEAGVIVVQIILFVIGALVLGAIIRAGVKRGVEDVLYKKKPDGSWGVNPYIVEAIDEVLAQRNKPTP